MYTLAVDIVGTFTDCVAIDETGGHVTARKVPTTQDDLLRGVFAALDHIAGDLEISTPALLGDVSRFVHATTQSSNAVFARSGAPGGSGARPAGAGRTRACGWRNSVRERGCAGPGPYDVVLRRAGCETAERRAGSNDPSAGAGPRAQPAAGARE